MKHISNEQKAEDITKCLWFPQKCTEEDIQNMLMEMAQWKDNQFEGKKQQWIEKVTDFISQHFYISTSNHVISKKDYYSLTELIRDINQAMEE